MFHRLVGLFEDYRRRMPDRSEPYFMLALALAAQSDGELARIAYAHGLNRLEEDDPYLKAGLMFAGETPYAGDIGLEALAGVWAPHDPLMLTPSNERLMEHYQRVAYANLRFSEDPEMQDGWLRDRGNVYIRYGAPDERFIATSSTEPDQLWSYADFSVSFFKRRTGPWAYRGGLIGRRESRQITDLIEAFPPISKVSQRWTRFPVSCRIAQFRGEGKRTRVDFHVSARDTRFVSTKGPRGARRVDVDHGVFAMNLNWELIEKSEARLDRMAWLKGDREGGYFVRSDFLSLLPGPYQVRVESLDLSSRRLGVFHDTIDVRSFARGDLTLSDIVINRRSAKRPGGEGRAGIIFLPAPDASGVRGKRLEAYAEVYNLDIIESRSETAFTVQFEVRSAEDRDGWVVVSTKTKQGVASWEPLVLTLDLTKTAPGAKVLRLRLTDHARSETIVTTTDFRVTW